jgi:hypothetical protein
VSGTRSKKRTSTPRSEGGKPAVKRKATASKRATEFLDSLLPETDEQSGTAFADRKAKRQIAHKMGVAYERVTQAFDWIEEFGKDEDALEPREWDDRDKRRRSDEKSRVRAENRADVRQMVLVEERRRAMRQQDWLLGLTTVTVLAAIVLAYLAVTHNQIEFAGASMFTFLLSGGEVLTLRWLRNPPGDPPAPGGSPVEPPPFKWSVVDVQPEVESEGRSPEE